MKSLFFTYHFIAILLYLCISCSCNKSAEAKPLNTNVIDMVPPLPEDDGYYLITCGQDQLYIIDEQTSNGKELNTVWSWKLDDAASQLPTTYMNYMKTLDDCKPVDDNTKLLLTSSTGGGVLLLERSTKKCLFYAHAPQAHSADLLPNGKIAVALSTTEKGNSIEIYDINKSEKVLFRDELHGAHGAVWMAARNRFYALGHAELREYSLKNWNTGTPQLVLDRSWNVPGAGGHDLSMVNNDSLLVSCNAKVHLFNINTGVFDTFEPLKNLQDVKSVNYVQSSGWVVYTKAEESYWTENIYMVNPVKKLTIPGYRMYKVRLMKKT